MCGYLGILAYLETVKCFGSKVTVVVTSCRKLVTIGLSSLLFGHALNGFHLVGVAAVFGGVLWNANSDLACSRWLAPPALVLIALIVALELELDVPSGANLAPLRSFLQTPLLN